MVEEKIHLTITYSSTEIENIGPPPLAKRIINVANNHGFSNYTVIIKIIDD